MTLRPLRSCCRRPLLAVSAALLLVACARPAAAQGESRFSGFIERLDRDGNKTLDPNELSQIQGPFRSMLESNGVDLSRSISTDELIDRMRRRSEQSGRDGGRDSGGRDSGGRDSGGRDSGRFGGFGRDREGSGRDMGRDSGGRDSGDHRQGAPAQNGPAHTAVPKSIVKREKTLVALPSQYAAGDTDHDGQIALSEWKAWKGRAALAEFSRLDTNADGFLTPRELIAASKGSTAIAAAAPAAPTTTAAAAPATPAATPAGTASTTPATATDAKPAEAKPGETKPAETKPGEAKPGEVKPGEVKPTETKAEPAKPAATTSPAPKAEAEDFSEFDGLSDTSTPTPAEPTGKAADDAKRYFDILDKDGDGKVGPKEWAASTRIRGDFTKAKIDLTQPIPRADFIIHYVRLNP